jgi:hypothetical protein
MTFARAAYRRKKVFWCILVPLLQYVLGCPRGVVFRWTVLGELFKWTQSLVNFNVLISKSTSQTIGDHWGEREFTTTLVPYPQLWTMNYYPFRVRYPQLLTMNYYPSSTVSPTLNDELLGLLLDFPHFLRLLPNKKEDVGDIALAGWLIRGQWHTIQWHTIRFVQFVIWCTALWFCAATSQSNRTTNNDAQGNWYLVWYVLVHPTEVRTQTRKFSTSSTGVLRTPLNWTCVLNGKSLFKTRRHSSEALWLVDFCQSSPKSRTVNWDWSIEYRFGKVHLKVHLNHKKVHLNHGWSILIGQSSTGSPKVHLWEFT